MGIVYILYGEIHFSDHYPMFGGNILLEYYSHNRKSTGIRNNILYIGW